MAPADMALPKALDLRTDWHESDSSNLAVGEVALSAANLLTAGLSADRRDILRSRQC